jgi:hypothetical protein
LSGVRRDVHDDLLAMLSVGLTLAECRLPASGFLDVVSKVGERRGVEARGLAVRARLHLPRVARPDGTVGRRLALAEVSRSVRHLSADVTAIRRLVPTGGVRDLEDLRFVVYDDDKAFAVFTHMHYLRSARPGSVNFALVDGSSGLPVALCSATPLDWRRLGSALEQRYGVPVQQIWDISRVYSFEVAPYNAISRLLAQVRRWFRSERRNVRLLVTTVDPNLGFTGASYRAANWQEWLRVRPRPYLYLNRQYVSPRQLRQEFGTSGRHELRERLGVRLEVSRAALLTSSIYGWRLKGATEPIPGDQMPILRR